MKKLLAVLLVLVMCLSLMACQKNDDSDNTIPQKPTTEETAPKETEPEETEPEETEPEQESAVTPLLYKVSDEAGNVIWLFGSIHVGVEEYYPLPDYVLDAFRGSDALAVEANIVAFEKDLAGQVNMLKKMVYTDGTNIKDHLSEETYQRAVEILKENSLYSAAYDAYYPVLWWNLIDNAAVMQADVDAELGIDRYMIELAEDEDKQILEVESAEFQYDMLASFSQELQVYLLEMVIEGYEQDLLVPEIYELVTLWGEGNEESFQAYLTAQEEVEREAEALLYQEYNDALIVSRNEAMTEYAVDALESGEELFICVGAAHVIGEGAMAENLRALGYTVEIVR